MKVSFLLGAGFSRPAGYPLAPELSNIVLRAQASGIATDPEGDSWFLEEFLEHLASSPNEVFHRPDTPFAQSKGAEALEAVLTVYGQQHPLTNYEDFYDELNSYVKGDVQRINNATFQEECARLGLHTDDRRQGESSHVHQALYMAFEIFSQLLEQLIKPDLNAASPNAGESYQRLFNLIRTNIPRRHNMWFDEPAAGHTFYIHTLNHDLFVERYLEHEDIQESIGYCDGFDEMGSPYYGRLDFGLGYEFPPAFRQRPHHAHVRMPRFTGEFSGPVQLFKLHGSLDYWSFGVERNDVGLYEPLVVKKQPWLSHLNLYREVEAKGRHDYRNDFTNYHPLFLGGTTAKLEQYDDPILFRKLFEQFGSNLSHSDILVIIGYGFRDAGINERILPFLQDSTKKVIVIGRDFPEHFSAIKREMFHSGGLEGYDFSELEALLNR